MFVDAIVMAKDLKDQAESLTQQLNATRCRSTIQTTVQRYKQQATNKGLQAN